LRKEHCFFAVLSNGRCIAPCHYNQGTEHDGDCTGNDNQIMGGIREVPVSCGFTPYEGSGQEKLDKQKAYLERMKGQYGI